MMMPMSKLINKSVYEVPTRDDTRLQHFKTYSIS